MIPLLTLPIMSIGSVSHNERIMTMTLDDMSDITRVVNNAGLNAHVLCVALYIASDYASDPKIIQRYGTGACDELRVLAGERAQSTSITKG